MGERRQARPRDYSIRRERKRAAASRCLSYQALFRVLFDLAPDGILVTGRGGRILMANQQADALFGYARGELVGQPVEVLIPGRLRGVPRRSHKRFSLEPRVRPTGTKQEAFGQRKDGSSVRVEIRLSQLELDGTRINMAAIRGAGELSPREGADGHGERGDEEHLRLVQTVLDELPCGLYLIHGPDARLVLANRAVANIWGSPWLVGEPMAEFLTRHGIHLCASDGQTLPLERSAALRATRHGEVVRQYEELIRRSDGVALPVLVNAIPLDSHALCWAPVASSVGQEAIGDHLALVVQQDVSALKQAEQMKDEFLAIAAHELRNPVTVVAGYAQLLSGTTGGAHSRRGADLLSEALRGITDATARLVTLTDDLLDATHLQAGRLALRLEPHDLVALVRRVVSHAVITTGNHPIKVSAPPRYLVANIDVGRIEQVLVNLLTNAVKYSPDGGGIEVSLWDDATSGTVEVSVRDHGIGIPPDQQGSLFGRFARAANARERGIEGTGLGLYLCRELVERHGGRIWFTSAAGQGATFTFTLPLAPSG